VAPHVDDRDVDAADVANQVDRFLATGRLLALEAILQRPPHADSDDRVTIDDKALWTLAQDRFRYLGVRRWLHRQPWSPAADPNPVRAVR
jgi:hypothetical protein